MTHEPKTSLPIWLMLLIFVLIEATFFLLGDTFTFLLGTFITIIVFANGYDRNAHHGESH